MQFLTGSKNKPSKLPLVKSQITKVTGEKPFYIENVIELKRVQEALTSLP